MAKLTETKKFLYFKIIHNLDKLFKKVSLSLRAPHNSSHLAIVRKQER